MTKLDLAPDAGSYKPAAVYHADSDCVEYVKYDGYCIYERVDGYLTLIKDATGHTLVGFKLKGFRNWFDNIKTSLRLSDNHFLPMMSAIEAVYTKLGDSMFGDARREAAYRAAYQLAANENVQLSEEELLAA